MQITDGDLAAVYMLGVLQWLPASTATQPGNRCLGLEGCGGCYCVTHLKHTWQPLQKHWMQLAVNSCTRIQKQELCCCCACRLVRCRLSIPSCVSAACPSSTHWVSSCQEQQQQRQQQKRLLQQFEGQPQHYSSSSSTSNSTTGQQCLCSSERGSSGSCSISVRAVEHCWDCVSATCHC